MPKSKRKLPDPSGELRRGKPENRKMKIEIDAGEPGSGSRDDARLDERDPSSIAREHPGGSMPPLERKTQYRNTDET